jgi:hypothetical protein
LDALRTHIASVALLACHARRSLNALRSRGTNCTGWTRDALDALHASLARRAGWTALASVALLACHAWNALRTRNALLSCNASDACWSRWANGTSGTRNPLRSYIAAITLYARCTRHAGNALRSCHASNALRALRTGRPRRTDFASRTGYTRRSLRTSHASHSLRSLRSLRTSKANLRPRCEINSKPPELVVRQRQNEHPRFTPQLRDCVSLSDVGDAAKATLAVASLMRGVRVSRVERHDRSEYVSASDLRHVTTRLTVPVIGYVDR